MRSTSRWAKPTRAGVRPIAGAAIAGMVVALGLPLAAISASAAVLPTHIINVFPNRDFVMAEGYAPGSTHTVNIVRGGVTIGTSAAVANAAGFVEVNHPAIFPDVKNCWGIPSLNVTPDIRPGDEVQVVTGTAIESTITAGINLTQRAAFAAGTVTLHGTAPGATPGTRIPDAQMEVRVNAKNTKFLKNGRASVRADIAGSMDGTVTWDAPLPSTAWTATFLGMGGINPAYTPLITDGQRAVNSESVAMAILNVQEITNSEASPDPAAFVKGPALPDCTAPAAVGPTKPAMTATTDTGASSTDGITNNQTPTFFGVPVPADATIVSLYDGNHALIGTDSALVGGAYSITPTTALALGTHNITVGQVGPSTGASELMGNTPAAITIDNVLPTVATKTPAANATAVNRLGNLTVGFSENVTAVNTGFSLKTATNATVAAVVTYNAATRVATLDPSAGLAPGARYSAQLSGLIKDVAGNSVAPLAWSFTTATGPTVPDAPVIGIASPGAIGGAITATARWTPPASNGGSVINGYVVIARRMNAAGAVVGTTISPFQVATRRELTMTLPAPANNYRFEVRARNALGTGAFSARSQLITAR